MEKGIQPAIKKDYKSVKEAFDALPAAVKQHSIRVAEYTRALYVEAVGIELRVGTSETEKLDLEYERIAYLCGLYHDIGKAMIAEQYHNLQPNFGEEEVALYRRHVTDGVAIVESLPLGEQLTDLNRTMLTNALRNHHASTAEGGFPQVKKEQDIPMMALIVGVADRIDHLVTSRRSETPFEDVMGEMMAAFPEDAENELELLLKESMQKLHRVFVKYQNQSRLIPVVPMFVKRKNGRPFELQYRPVMDRRQKAAVGLQAKLCFKDNPETYADLEEVKTILNKNKQHSEVGRYFLYEAADMLRRMRACQISASYIAVELLPRFYAEAKIVPMIEQLYADARMEPGHILLSVEETLLDNPSKALTANLERASKANVPLYLSGWSGKFLKAEDVCKYSFKKVALHPDVYPKLGEPEMAEAIQRMQEAGMEIIAGELDKTRFNGALNGLGITAMTGPLAGNYACDTDVITAELAAGK